MTKKEAQKALKIAEKNGYVRYHSGIVTMEDGNKRYYGINIDGDGREGRLFGCPRIIWDMDYVKERFGQ